MEQLIRSLVAQTSLMTSRIGALEKLVASGGMQFSPVADPAPDDGGWGGGWGGWGGRFGGFGGFGGGIGPIDPSDPSPLELGKLSKLQLESRLSDIVFARKKLDMLEGLLKEAVAKF